MTMPVAFVGYLWNRVSRFRLRALLVFVTVASLLIGRHVQAVKREAAAVARFQKSGAVLFEGQPDPIGPNFLWSRSLLEEWHRDGIPVVYPLLPDLQSYLIVHRYDRIVIHNGNALSNSELRSLCNIQLRAIALHGSNERLDFSILKRASGVDVLAVWADSLTPMQVDELCTLKSLDTLVISVRHLSAAERELLEDELVHTELEFYVYDPTSQAAP